jgi:NAD(P)-dependent dehydrogenase (short-subunit alcohol dehydrogenase family)
MAAARRVVLITGVNGYIATHTAAAFLRAGFAVRGTVRTRTPALVQTLERTLEPYHDGDRLEVVEVPDIGENGAFDCVVESWCFPSSWLVRGRRLTPMNPMNMSGDPY